MAPVPAAAQTLATAGDPLGCAANDCDLMLKDAMGLALARMPPLLNSRLDRDVQRISLDVVADCWSPRVAVGPFVGRDRMSHRAGVGAWSSLRVPIGGGFALGWDKTLSSRSDGSGSQTFSFSRPLLKGAWAGFDSATVRQARLEERIGILTFRRTAADLVVAVIGAYRALIGARRQVEIGEDSLLNALMSFDRTARRVQDRWGDRLQAAPQ